MRVCRPSGRREAGRGREEGGTLLLYTVCIWWDTLLRYARRCVALFRPLSLCRRVAASVGPEADPSSDGIISSAANTYCQGKFEAKQVFFLFFFFSMKFQHGSEICSSSGVEFIEVNRALQMLRFKKKKVLFLELILF